MLVVLADTMRIQGCICLAASSRLLPEFFSSEHLDHISPALSHHPSVSQVSNAVISDLLQRGPQQGLSGEKPRSDTGVELCVQGSAADYGA